MNYVKYFLVFSLTIFFVSAMQGQKTCKVLAPNLSGDYEGKCKKGLAHGKGKAVGTDTYEGNFRKGLPSGKGVYTWASGASYDGSWMYGQREGSGVYKFKYDGKDSVQAGVWKEDVYKGPKPRNPKLITKRNLDKYTFKRKGDGNQIDIRVFQSGRVNNSIENYTIIGSSGNSYSRGSVESLENISFPVIVKVAYRTLNKARTVWLDVAIEFEIFEEGNWEVLLYN